jgi:hypothetical protein
MPRCLLIALLVLAAAARSAEAKALPKIRTEEIASPGGPGALGASLALAPDGTTWLSWVQPARGAPHALRFATFDGATKAWRSLGTIIADKTVTTNPMDFPQLAVGPGASVTAIWTDGKGGARYARSTDRGATWSAPESFMADGTTVEKFSLAPLADGRVLTAWLDGRGMKSGGKMQQLYARILGAIGPDTLIDPSVCDCCPTAARWWPTAAGPRRRCATSAWPAFVAQRGTVRARSVMTTGASTPAPSTARAWPVIAAAWRSPGSPLPTTILACSPATRPTLVRVSSSRCASIAGHRPGGSTA